MSNSPDAHPRRVRADALASFVTTTLRKLDVPESDARTTADVLVRADLYGVDSHGVARLGFYVHKLRAGLVNPKPEPRIVRDTGIACVIDADNGLGPVASVQAMDRCIAGARDSALACATVGHSNHYGIAGYYALRAVDAGMIGIAMTNATSLVAPTFGRRPMLGTNPIAVAVPTREERPYLFDAATSAVSFGKLQLAAAEGRPIPEGWAIDVDGASTTNPSAGMVGSLLPLGSTRELGSHKGYNLAVIVDIFSGLLSGSAYGPHCLSLTSEASQVADVGHFFAAVRVDAFLPLDEFTARMDEMIRGLRDTPPAAGEERVLVAGDPEFDEEERRQRDGIPLPPHVEASLRAVAQSQDTLDEFEALVASCA